MIESRDFVIDQRKSVCCLGPLWYRGSLARSFLNLADSSQSSSSSPSFVTYQGLTCSQWSMFLNQVMQPWMKSSMESVPRASSNCWMSSFQSTIRMIHFVRYSLYSLQQTPQGAYFMRSRKLYAIFMIVARGMGSTCRAEQPECLLMRFAGTSYFAGLQGTRWTGILGVVGCSSPRGTALRAHISLPNLLNIKYTPSHLPATHPFPHETLAQQAVLPHPHPQQLLLGNPGLLRLKPQIPLRLELAGVADCRSLHLNPNPLAVEVGSMGILSLAKLLATGVQVLVLGQAVILYLNVFSESLYQTMSAELVGQNDALLTYRLLGQSLAQPGQHDDCLRPQFFL